jgi:PBP1b-binding outer membrane lipoprotein LpoB
MKNAIGLMGATLLLTGCLFHHQPQLSGTPAGVQTTHPVIQPDLHARGEVVMVNAEAHFVVVSFPPGTVPPAGHSLKVYRNGLRVGEIKVTGPQRENNTVADIVTGDLQTRDEARDE